MASKFTKNEKKRAPKGVEGDDRNVVLVDDDFQDADFEDKVWLFWKRHGKSVVAGALFVFFSVLGVIIYVQGKKMHAQALQDEFALAKTPEARLAFAESHRSDAMSGTVFYALANEAFSAGQFDVAAQRYSDASSVYGALSGEEFSLARDRAAMSAALSLSKSGKSAEAVQGMTALAGSLTTDETIRGQAMFNLAVLALSAKELATARKWLGEMDRALSPLNIWHREKSNLLSIAPELASAPAETAEISAN